MLQSALRRHRVAVHGYALMTTHTHLLLTPTTVEGTSKAMQLFGDRYVGYFNKRYQRVGTLWTGRYGAKAINDERYWLTCLRYIEQNPVRAGLVVQADQYRWSSYAVHALGHTCDWLASHPLLDALGKNPAARQQAYRALSAVPLTTHETVRERAKD